MRNASETADIETPLVLYDNASDRRLHRRVPIRLAARYMLPNREEFACRTTNASAGGVLLEGSNQAKKGDNVIVYLEELGRFEGSVVRANPDRFAVCFKRRASKINKTADTLTLLTNQGLVTLREARRAPRTAVHKRAHARLENGGYATCRVLDVSISGASIEIANRPDIGSQIEIGAMRGRVVRHHEDGVAIEFDNRGYTPPPLSRAG